MVQIGMLLNNVLLRLNESANTLAFNVATGVGGTDVVGQTAGFITLLNDAASEICRTCYPLAGNVSYQVPGGTESFSMDVSPGAGGARMIAPRSVTLSGSPSAALTYCSRARLELWNPTGSSPLYWYMDGPRSIGLAPIPAADSVILVDGYVVPAPIPTTTDLTQSVSWIQADVGRLIEYYICREVARKNAEDPTLAARIEAFDPLFRELQARLHARIPEELKAYFVLPMAAA